ncbi:hypothetical protein ACQ4PT_016406 [Festuca glaucescens]
MPEEDVRAIASVLRRRAPCNLLVFGLGAETPLWRALNHGGRTVFLDENPFYVAHMEGAHGPGLEAYDVAYATAVRELPDLLDAARASRRAECRPVQNLLFSECRLAITDLPNGLYDVAWGRRPRGRSPRVRGGVAGEDGGDLLGGGDGADEGGGDGRAGARLPEGGGECVREGVPVRGESGGGHQHAVARSLRRARRRCRQPGGLLLGACHQEGELVGKSVRGKDSVFSMP